jgi:hypothetical protein
MYFDSISLYSGHELSNEKEIAFSLVRVRFVTQFLFFGISPCRSTSSGWSNWQRKGFFYFLFLSLKNSQTKLH